MLHVDFWPWRQNRIFLYRRLATIFRQRAFMDGPRGRGGGQPIDRDANGCALRDIRVGVAYRGWAEARLATKTFRFPAHGRCSDRRIRIASIAGGGRSSD